MISFYVISFADNRDPQGERNPRTVDLVFLLNITIRELRSISQEIEGCSTPTNIGARRSYIRRWSCETFSSDLILRARYLSDAGSTNGLYLFNGFAMRSRSSAIF